jgi:hypothetical protein
VQWTREVSASNRPQERNRDLCPLLTTTVIKIYIYVYCMKMVLSSWVKLHCSYFIRPLLFFFLPGHLCAAQ